MRSCRRRLESDDILRALAIVQDHWFEFYTPVRCAHIAKDYKMKGHVHEPIPKILIKSSWAEYYYQTGIPLIIQWRETQSIFNSTPCQLKDRMILEEMKGVCDAIRIMHRDKCVIRMVVR